MTDVISFIFVATLIGSLTVLFNNLIIEKFFQKKEINIEVKDNDDKIFTNKINELIKNEKNVIELKEYKKLHKKHLKLISLLNDKTKDLLKDNILILLEKSIQNLITINKIQNILDILNTKKLNKSNKREYKKNEILLKNFQKKSKESLNTYDYIILKLIDIENKHDFDYEEIKTHINNIINLNINKYGYDLDGYLEKYPKILDEFGSNLNKNNIRNLH